MSRRVSFRGAVGEQKEPVVVRLGRAAAGGRALGRLAGPVLVGLLLMRTAVGQEPSAAEGPPAGEPPQPPAFVSLDRHRVGKDKRSVGPACFADPVRLRRDATSATLCFGVPLVGEVDALARPAHSER